MEEVRESGIYIKAHIASRILSGLEKETPLCKETSTSDSKSEVEERIVGVIVGSETLSTS